MATGDPIKLGSALQPRLIFKDGSTITTDATGIQSCSVIGQCADGANVFNYVPLAGATFDSVFGNSYMPATFKVDYTGGGAQITYLKGGAAEIQLNFKRPDPTQTGAASRKISVDSVTKFVKINGVFFGVDVPQNTEFVPPITIAIPEPIVTVTYNSSTAPSLSSPSLALPSDTAAIGFPPVPPDFSFPFPLSVFGVAGNTDIVVATAADHWQRTELKWEPVADSSAFAVTEYWRRQFFTNFGDELS
jgi:hypothetical protein